MTSLRNKETKLRDSQNFSLYPTICIGDARCGNCSNGYNISKQFSKCKIKKGKLVGHYSVCDLHNREVIK